MTVWPGEIIGLIGPNGAGKTTTFNVITGDFPPTEGRVVFEERDITGLKPHQAARLGIVRTFQLTALFPQMSVLENVLIGLHIHSTIGFIEAMLNSRSNQRKELALADGALKILEFMGLWKGGTSRPGPCPTACSGPWASPSPWPPDPSCSSLTNP